MTIYLLAYNSWVDDYNGPYELHETIEWELGYLTDAADADARKDKLNAHIRGTYDKYVKDTGERNLKVETKTAAAVKANKVLKEAGLPADIRENYPVEEIKTYGDWFTYTRQSYYTVVELKPAKDA